MNDVMNNMGGFMNGLGGFGWGSGFGWILMILFWVLIIVGVFAIVKGLSSNTNAPPAKTALDILKERFVRGEIEREEFEQKKQVLMQ